MKLKCYYGRFSNYLPTLIFIKFILWIPKKQTVLNWLLCTIWFHNYWVQPKTDKFGPKSRYCIYCKRKEDLSVEDQLDRSFSKFRDKRSNAMILLEKEWYNVDRQFCPSIFSSLYWSIKIKNKDGSVAYFEIDDYRNKFPELNNNED